MAEVATTKKRGVNHQRDLDTTNRSPSSKMRNLLLHTIALAKAIIWRCPMERLFPPLAISLSRVSRASSPSAWREKSPDARNASFNVASSFCENGSKFRRRVPANRGHSNCSTLRRFCWRLTTQKLGLALGKFYKFGCILNEPKNRRTICGMMVTLDLRASRLIMLVEIPS